MKRNFWVFLNFILILDQADTKKTMSTLSPPAPPNELEGTLLDIASASTSYISNLAFTESRNRLLQTVQSFVNETAIHLYGNGARDDEQLLDDKKQVRRHARKLLRLTMEKGTKEGLKMYSNAINQWEN